MTRCSSSSEDARPCACGGSGGGAFRTTRARQSEVWSHVCPNGSARSYLACPRVPRGDRRGGSPQQYLVFDLCGCVSVWRVQHNSCEHFESKTQMHPSPGPFRIRDLQQNLGYFQIYPDASVGIISPSNVREKRKTLLESSPHAQSPREKTDEHKMLLRARSCCLQNGALSESLFRSPCPSLHVDSPHAQLSHKLLQHGNNR